MVSKVSTVRGLTEKVSTNSTPQWSLVGFGIRRYVDADPTTDGVHQTRTLPDVTAA